MTDLDLAEISEVPENDPSESLEHLMGSIDNGTPVASPPKKASTDINRKASKRRLGHRLTLKKTIMSIEGTPLAVNGHSFLLEEDEKIKSAEKNKLVSGNTSDPESPQAISTPHPKPMKHAVSQKLGK